MAELLRTAVPRPVRCDLTKLAIDSTDAFLLSQVDGRSTLEDLAAVCGLSMRQVERIVTRLADAGALELADRPKRRRSSMAMQSSHRSPSRVPDAPGVLAGALVPRVIDRAAVASHAVDAQEAFVLAQIDGRTPIDDIVAVTGVSRFDVSVVLTPLIQTGALELDDPHRAKPARPRHSVKPRGRTVAPEPVKRAGRHTVAPRTTKHPAQRQSHAPKPTTRLGRQIVAPAAKTPTTRLRRQTVAPSPGKTPTTRLRRQTVAPAAKMPTTRPRRPTVAPAPASVRHPTRKSMRAPPKSVRRPPPADDVCELDAELQARVDGMLARLRTATHYELLGVTRDAPKKAIKRAYFELAAVLHPDRQFRKKLGPYKARLHDVFVRVTVAHDTLVDAMTRALYDGTLPPEPAAPALTPAAPSAPSPPPRRKSSMRLPPLRVPSTVAPPKPAPVSRRSERPFAPPPAPEALLRFFVAKTGNASRDRVRVFVDAAEGARASGNYLSAAQNYQLALQACETPEVRVALEEVAGQARDQGYARDVKAAAIAERDQQWDEAVRRYGKAYEAVPGAHVADRLAHALRMQGSDLRRAVKVAEDAVLREPANVTYRLTLGNACADAGLWTRAKGESERVSASAPKDEGAMALAARVKGKG